LLTGEEISRVALADSGTKFKEGKLERVRQGYCGRSNCKSYFYRINLTAFPGLDWEAVREKVRAQLAGPQKPAEEKNEPKLPKKRRPNFRAKFWWASPS